MNLELTLSDGGYYRERDTAYEEARKGRRCAANDAVEVRPRRGAPSALTAGITSVILLAMKTAVSIPDRIFESAERFARRRGMTRSELYAKALDAYLDEHKAEGITERLDAIYAGESAEESRLDPVLGRMQADSIPAEDDW